MHRTVSTALVLVLPALAGCLAPTDAPIEVAADSGPLEALTEATLGFGPFVSLKVPSYDGTKIHVDVQLPDGEGPYPVLIEYTPYSLLGDEQWALSSERGRKGKDALLRSGLAEYYVPRGYAVGVAHVRGTGESGGCLTIGGPEEGKDGYAVVEHLANESWSNGRVALLGTSYVGTTPIETAILDPPHLTTIIPISAVTEWYKYYFELGEQRVNGDPPPGSSYPDPILWMTLGVAPGVRTGAASPDDARCVAEYWQNYWAQDDYNAFWKARDHGSFAADIRVPVLFAHGWGDENVATNMIPDFWGGLRTEKRAFLQQHGHGVPGSKEAFHSYVHRWLDHYMLDKRNGALDLPTVVVEDNLGKFRVESDWPPPDATPLRLHLAEDKTLGKDPPTDGARSWRDDGVGREARELEGVNHLAFASAPFEEEIHVSGVPRVHLRVASDARDTLLAVHVYDRADGKDKLITRGYLDARHRESLETGADLVPGTAYDFEFGLHPRDHRVEKGHSIVVVVKSCDRYVICDTTRATNTLTTGAEGSWIDLPTVPASGRTFLDGAPIPWE